MSDQSNTGLLPKGQREVEDMGAAVMPEDSGPPLTTYEGADTAPYEEMSVEELVAEHAKLDEQRSDINAQMVAVDEVRARKEFEAEQAAVADQAAEAQTADAAGAEPSKA